MGGVTIPSIKRDNNCFVGLYVEQSPHLLRAVFCKFALFPRNDRQNSHYPVINNKIPLHCFVLVLDSYRITSFVSERSQDLVTPRSGIIKELMKYIFKIFKNSTPNLIL